ncbi:MAG: TIGR02391 family protein [Candidatus Acidiferrum sp.]|jgi:hypothetical protein
MAKRADTPAPGSREFRSPEELDSVIGKLNRRVDELEKLDVRAAVFNHTGAVKVARSNVRETIRAVFGSNSPEFAEHQYLDIWAGPMHMGMHDREIVQGTERGRGEVIAILKGLIGRLEEKRFDFGRGDVAAPSSYFDRLNLHPRIRDVARDRFMDGYHWGAVFAASKALINFIKERSGLDIDGASLVRTAFSRNNPIFGVQ